MVQSNSYNSIGYLKNRQFWFTHLRGECLSEGPAEHDVDGGEVGDRAADGDHREAHALQTEGVREREYAD